MRTLKPMLIAASFAVAQSIAAKELPLPQSIISINMCTDQLLLDLAEPSKIMGLSP